MISPEAFAAGLGRGTGSLVTNVAGGALRSGLGIVESLSRGIAAGGTAIMSSAGERAYAQTVADRRRENKVASSGALEGLLSGGESVVAGLAAGFSGLVLTPLDEGRRGGALGFAKGLGLGALGAVVKPVLGVTDGIASVAHGLANQISDVRAPKAYRPPRALNRSPFDLQG